MSSAHATEESFYVPVTWLVKPSAAVLPEGAQQKPLGEFLFIQNLTSARVVSLLEQISVPAWRDPTRNVALPAGTTLLQVNGAAPFSYCDGDISDPMRNALLDVNARLCLVDRENDGAFDLLYWGGLDMRSDFMPMGLNRAANANVSIRYVDAPPRPILEAGLIVTRRLGGYRLEFAVKDGDSAVALGDVEGLRPIARRPIQEVRFRSRDLPTTLTYSGAQVTITAISDGVVHYEVITPFDPDGTFGVAVTRAISRINEGPNATAP